MAGISRISGVGQILQNIRKASDPIKQRTSVNLARAGLFVQRESQKRVPVHTGNLKNSAFTRRTRLLEVTVGYTAAYAVFVHENLEMKLKGQPRPKTKAGSRQGKYWDPQGRGQSKFLENAYKENLATIRRIIRGEE